MEVVYRFLVAPIVLNRWLCGKRDSRDNNSRVILRVVNNPRPEVSESLSFNLREEFDRTRANRKCAPVAQVLYKIAPRSRLRFRSNHISHTVRIFSRSSCVFQRRLCVMIDGGTLRIWNYGMQRARYGLRNNILTSRILKTLWSIYEAITNHLIQLH